MHPVTRTPVAQRGNGTAGLLIISALLLLGALVVSSLIFNALRGHGLAGEENVPFEQFAPAHRPFVPPPPDQESQPKQGSLLQIQYVNWLTI